MSKRKEKGEKREQKGGNREQKGAKVSKREQKGAKREQKGSKKGPNGTKGCTCSIGRITDEKSIMSVSSWMLLRLKQGIKVPEAAFDVIIGWHFTESHFQENLSIFGSHFQ